MPVLRQIVEALALSIENFFCVPWQSVVSLLFVIVGLGYYTYSRTVYGYIHPPDQILRSLSWVGVWGGLAGVARFGKRPW